MDRKIKVCDECKSNFYGHSSPMPGLCPECAHILYGYANCRHDFQKGRCTKCHWNGQNSDYIKKLKKKG